jgi:hypothetical protein
LLLVEPSRDESEVEDADDEFDLTEDADDFDGCEVCINVKPFIILLFEPNKEPFCESCV